VARAAISGERAISYSDLALRLEMPNPTGRGLGAILDEAAAKCRENQLPDVSAFVVAKESLAAGEPMPSRDSFDTDGFWPRSGVHMSEIPALQGEIRKFDWKAIRALGLQ
jgi:hypothetical protein